MKNKIKFIYFDVGGVLVKDFSTTNKWDLMISEWEISEDNKSELHELFKKFEGKVCLGEKSVEEFLPLVEKKFGVKFSKNYSLNQDFVNRFNKNEGLEEIIAEFKDKYKFGLLTNMYPGMLNLIKEKKLIPKIEWIIVDSSVEKCKKPEEKIYEVAQKMAGFKAEEILFVDNKKDNLEIPKKMGWQCFYYESSDYEKSNRQLKEFLG